MKQIIQPVGGGDLAVVEAPVPMIGPTEILVATSATAISAGLAPSSAFTTGWKKKG